MCWCSQILQKPRPWPEDHRLPNFKSLIRDQVQQWGMLRHIKEKVSGMFWQWETTCFSPLCPWNMLSCFGWIFSKTFSTWHGKFLTQLLNFDKKWFIWSEVSGNLDNGGYELQVYWFQKGKEMRGSKRHKTEPADDTEQAALQKASL